MARVPVTSPMLICWRYIKRLATQDNVLYGTQPFNRIHKLLALTIHVEVWVNSIQCYFQKRNSASTGTIYVIYIPTKPIPLYTPSYNRLRDMNEHALVKPKWNGHYQGHGSCALLVGRMLGPYSNMHEKHTHTGMNGLADERGNEWTIMIIVHQKLP